jgi:hypothetical protein
LEKKSITKDAQRFVYDHEYILILKPKVKSVDLSTRNSLREIHTQPDKDNRGPWNSAAYTLCNKK